MGFGTLFIGYFLVLNIAYYGYTDLIAALIMLLGTYRLSAVSPEFKKCFILLIPFAALGAYEIISEFVSMFSPADANGTVTGIIGILRCSLLAAITFILLSGIKKLACEVDLPMLRDKAKSLKITSVIAYSFALILEIPALDKLIPQKALAVIALLSLIFTFAVSVSILTAIYSAYMRICMPEDVDMEVKPSRFAFINRFREKQAQREQQTQEELATMLSGKLFEQHILTIFPLGLIAYLNLSADGFFYILYTTAMVRIVMTICLFVYLAAVGLAWKIGNIRV